MHEHGLARATHVRKREQRRGLVDVRALCITRVGSLAIPRDSDVVYAPRPELRRVDEREEIGKKKAGGDFFRRE
jgi:hypothetical protein